MRMRDVQAFKKARRAVEVHQLALAGLKKLPAPIKPHHQQQRGLQATDGLDPETIKVSMSNADFVGGHNFICLFQFAEPAERGPA